MVHMGHFDLICIGCGPAGEKAATQAAYFRKSVAVIESATCPGGAMVNTGTVASKALRETALLCSAFRRRPIPGVEMGLDRKVSVARFMARCHLVQMQEHDRIEQSLDRHAIKVLHGHGRIVDPHTVCVTDQLGAETRHTAEHILIATGTRPHRPEHITFTDSLILDASTVLSIDRLPDSMVIVGGGVIASEYACVFAEMGVRVTMLEPRDSILPFLDADCRAILLQEMQRLEIRVLTGSPVASARPISNERQVEVTTTHGESHLADMMLWALGREGNTRGLGLDTVGIETDSRGLIRVNERYQTVVPSIYAAGDVIGFPALASTGMEQGRIAACRMFDVPFKQRLAETVPIGIYTIPAVSSVGLSEEDARKQGRLIVVGRARYVHNVRGRMLGDETGLVKVVFDRETHAVLGAAVVGQDATELIHVAQLAIVGGMTLHDLIEACFNYPSLTEMFKYAAYNALQTMAADENRSDVLAGSVRVA